MSTGDLVAAEQSWRNALGSCRTASSSDPRYVISSRGLGQCLQQQGKLEQAAEVYKKLIGDPATLDPANSDLLAAAMEYALVLHKQGLSDQAASLDEKLAPLLQQARSIPSPAPTIIQFHPGDQEPKSPERIKWESADGNCSHNPPVAPISIPPPRAAAEDADDEKLPGENRDRIVEHTDKWQILAERGLEYLRQERYMEAEEVLREAYAETRLYHRRDQSHQNVMLDLAMSFAGQGKRQECEIMFRKAFKWAGANTGEISDETIRVWERYSSALRKMGRPDQAQIAEARYEETLFKLNNARGAGLLRSNYGPITHINSPPSLFGRKAPRPQPSGAGSLYQYPQNHRHYVPSRQFAHYQDW